MKGGVEEFGRRRIAMYYEGQEGSAMEAGLNYKSLRESRGGSVLDTQLPVLA
jgi:hypothetical protein